MNTDTTAAELLEAELFNNYAGDQFNRPMAELFAIYPSGKTSLLAFGGDVYDIISETIHADNNPTDLAGIALTTTGWAAPVNMVGQCDTAPSKHPERRRVLLTAIVNAGGLFSVIRFQDTPHETTVEAGGIGSLAHALTDLWETVGQ